MFSDTEAYLFSDNVSLRKKYNGDVTHLSKEIYRLVDACKSRDETIVNLKTKVTVREIGMQALGKKVNALFTMAKNTQPEHKLFELSGEKSPFGKDLHNLDTWYKGEIIKELKAHNIPLDRIKEIWHGNS